MNDETDKLKGIAKHLIEVINELTDVARGRGFTPDEIKIMTVSLGRCVRDLRTIVDMRKIGGIR